MWRSTPSRFLFSSLLGGPVRLTGCLCVERPIRSWVHLSSSSSPSSRGAPDRGGRDGDGELMSFSEAKKPMKRNLGKEQDNQAAAQDINGNIGPLRKQRVGENISKVDKRKFLINTLFDLKDSREAVYGTLDAWVAWEHNFPLGALKSSLLILEKEQQWHRIVQAIKWMLSKGQGTTMGTYEQLIRALEKDNRAEEAHRIWEKKISHDLHSVPWRFCILMISVYYRNNMLERLVKLFKGLESYDRVPPNKSIVQKVADAYEMLDLVEEKSRVMEKYKYLFSEPPGGHFKKSRKASSKNEKNEGKKKQGTEHTSIEALSNGPVNFGPVDKEIDSIA